MKTILILGGGIMQLPAIRTAREMGLRVVVADGNSQAPGAAEADQFAPVDLRDKEGMVKLAESLAREGGLDGVFTAGTDFSVTVAWVAERLGLPGIPYRTALAATDKFLMRQAFREGGVAIPGFAGLGEKDDPAAVLDSLNFPLVLKPVDNMGARGIRRVDTPEELEESFRVALMFSRARKVIIEEYISGPEFSLDALVDGEQIVLCGFADRHIYFEPYFVELGHTMPTIQPQEVQDQVFEVFCRGIRALGITRGAAKGDMKLGPRGPVVGEIAARLSGGFMSGWTYPYASGVNPTLGALNLALGLPMGDMAPKQNKVSAERAFISIPGEITGLRGFEEAGGLPAVRFSHLQAEPGGRVAFPRNNVEKCGNFISQSSHRETAVLAAEEACRKVEIRLKSSDKETRDFLLGRTYPWVPGAYSLEIPENRAFLAILPPALSPGLSQGLSQGLAPDGREGAVVLAGLPDLQAEGCRDWLGLGFQDALERVFRMAGPVEWGTESYDLGGIFWRAFLRGGYQGGVWIIDTWREASRRGETEKLIEEWR